MSQMFVGDTETADVLFKQAREMAPQSAYVYAMSASYERASGQIGAALSHAEEACRRATRKTGSLCYAIKAQVLDAQRDKYGRVQALEKALEYDPQDVLTRHQYGVALSRAGRTEDAITQFSVIIEGEKNKVPATDNVLIALKTRIINLKRLSRSPEVASDIALAKEIIAKNPHLARNAREFAEFEEWG